MLRRFLAIFMAKLASVIARLFHLGHGSSLPGLLAEKIDPNIATKLSSKIRKGIILITGTNGKTTTAKLIANILKAAGLSNIHNLTGANLVRGVVSALISKANLFGKINADLGLFEIDEATMPEAIQKLKPKTILFNNLFRDQLDRYGEIDKIAKMWRKSIEKIPKETTLVLNVDDPSIAFLMQDEKRHVLTFGIEEESGKLKNLPHFADAIFCSRCNTKFEYKILYLSHLGKYLCPKCGLSRPKPRLFAQNINLKNLKSIELEINDSVSTLAKVNLFGFYNVYNILAAAAVARALSIPHKTIEEGLRIFAPAFGRFEKTKIGKTPATLLLIKNPTGATEVIHSLAYDRQPKNFFVILNDNIPDGRDVSWIWDTDWESLANFVNFIFISGKRAGDMILRLKYAQIPKEKIFFAKDQKEALFSACKKSGVQPLYILPNYSAMYELRNYLAEKGYLPKII